MAKSISLIDCGGGGGGGMLSKFFLVTQLP